MYRRLPYNNTLHSRHHFGPDPDILSLILPTQQNKTKITKAFRQERRRERNLAGIQRLSTSLAMMIKADSSQSYTIKK